MANVIVVGAQFGDEGKAKVTDLLAKNADVVVRYQGGCNAGHTVVVDGETYKFHLIPSGILYKKMCVLGPGMVIDPQALLTELDALLKRGLDAANLRISNTAHVTMPYHLALDAAEEESRGDQKIGTTKRGIGPTYADKCARTGIRIEDLLDKNVLRSKLEWLIPRKNVVLERLYNIPPFQVDEMLNQYVDYGEKIKAYVCDASELIFQSVGNRKNILFEGAQGTLLDLDHGSYPYVTSSSPSAGGACVGAGVGPTSIDRVIGVSKAYMTRVGEGPFPTEQMGEIGEKLRQPGTAWAEVGVTTGRPRRCGWFDTVLGPLLGPHQRTRLPGCNQTRCSRRIRRDPGLHFISRSQHGQDLQGTAQHWQQIPAHGGRLRILPRLDVLDQQLPQLQGSAQQRPPLFGLFGRATGCAHRHRQRWSQTRSDDRD